MTEYWKWTEYRWGPPPGKDWRDAKIITAGVDIGSVSSKAAIFTDDDLYAFAILRSGAAAKDSAYRVMNWALENTGMKIDDIHYIVGTGYGRVNVPFAHRTITEIACHARGANFIWGPSVRTVLDIGGQDVKVIKCDEKGRVKAFLMNDKCAAGTGRGMEVFADLVQIPITEIGKVSLQVEKEPEPVSSTCVVFARAEALGLLRSGVPVEQVVAAYHLAMAIRICELIEKIGVEKEFVITGGQSKNPGIVKRIEERIGIKALPPKPEYDPMLAGAIGAALFANAIVKKRLG